MFELNTTPAEENVSDFDRGCSHTNVGGWITVHRRSVIGFGEFGNCQLQYGLSGAGWILGCFVVPWAFLCFELNGFEFTHEGRAIITWIGCVLGGGGGGGLRRLGRVEGGHAGEGLIGFGEKDLPIEATPQV